MPTKLATKLNSKVKQQVSRKRPLWDGPCSDTKLGGITFSMLSRFLVCRERFRLLVVDGLKPPRTWEPRTGYGNMWHVCEEHWAKQNGESMATVRVKLTEYAREQCRLYPLQQEMICHWMEVCKRQFPHYVEYWSKHKDTTQRKPLLQEHVFSVPYKLPSGRAVFIRGKLDSVDIVTEKRKSFTYLQENKTKMDINEDKVANQLSFDCQTMLYMVALSHTMYGTDKAAPLAGVRYNVVRRPLSGGKGSIRQHKPSKAKPNGESKEEFYNRVDQLFVDDPGPDYYFMRWAVQVTKEDIQRFEQRFLTPVLEQLCDWWDYMEVCKYDPWNEEWLDDLNAGKHWQHPYGLYNVLNEGGHTDMDECLRTGSTVGLEHANTLFTELEE